MHDYLGMVMMIQPIDETSLILFDVSNEEKSRIVRQYNRALGNACGEGTDVAQIFLKPLITQYEKWGDPALIYGLCLAREGQFDRAEGSLSYAISNVLGSEQYLSIAQEALRMVREDIKNPPANLPSAEITDKIKSAQMSSGESPAERKNFQAPILMRAQKEYEAPRMATVKERRDIMMRSGSGADERPDDSLDIEDVMAPGEKLRRTVRTIAIIVGVAVLAALIVFVIVPLIKSNASGSVDSEKLSYLESLVEDGSSDPEVSQILSNYNAKFATDTADTSAQASVETTEATETTTTTTTTIVETTTLGPVIAETTTGDITTTTTPEE